MTVRDHIGGTTRSAIIDPYEWRSESRVLVDSQGDWAGTQSNPLVTVLPKTHFDSFGRMRVSQPATLFDSKQIFDKQPLYWDDQEVSGSGTTSVHSVNEAATTLGVALNTAGKRVRQTYQRFNYQPGKSQLFMMTGVPIISGGGAGIDACSGAFDENNGVFAQVDAGLFYFNCRSNYTGTPVDTRVAQADWNGDKMDGTGVSGITLAGNFSQILWFDMEWLGVGDVRLGFVVDGAFHLCHTFHNTNVNAGVYMSSPNLPIRYELTNDGTGAASEMMQICSTVISEGGQQPNGQLHYESTGATHVDANSLGTMYAVVGMRLKATYIGQAIDMTGVTMMNAGAQDFEWVLYFNPTVAGTFNYADHSNSSVQTATGATANTVTGGHELAGGFAKSSNSAGSIAAIVDNALRLGSAIDGTVDEIVLCVRPLSANADIHGGISWRELA